MILPITVICFEFEFMWHKTYFPFHFNYNLMRLLRTVIMFYIIFRIIYSSEFLNSFCRSTGKKSLIFYEELLSFNEPHNSSSKWRGHLDLLKVATNPSLPAGYTQFHSESVVGGASSGPYGGKHFRDLLNTSINLSSASCALDRWRWTAETSGNGVRHKSN